MAADSCYRFRRPAQEFVPMPEALTPTYHCQQAVSHWGEVGTQPNLLSRSWVPDSSLPPHRGDNLWETREAEER